MPPTPVGLFIGPPTQDYSDGQGPIDRLECFAVLLKQRQGTGDFKVWEATVFVIDLALGFVPDDPQVLRLCCIEVPVLGGQFVKGNGGTLRGEPTLLTPFSHLRHSWDALLCL